MANFEKHFVEKIEDLGYSLTYYDEFNNEVKNNLALCTNVFVGTKVLNGSIKEYIENPLLEAEFIGKTIKLPKKKIISIDYLLNKIEAENIYFNFSKNFKKLLEVKGYNTVSVYPTSYGIGVFALFTQGFKEIKNDIERLLTSLDIEYKNQYSSAGWVYRYVISKKKANIKKINNL